MTARGPIRKAFSPAGTADLMAIKGVLFDKDGTLIDVTGTWVPVYRELLAEVFADLGPEAIEAKFMAAGFDPEVGAIRPR